MYIILVIFACAIAYVALMNYLSGERHLFGNRIREMIRLIRIIRGK